MRYQQLNSSDPCSPFQLRIFWCEHQWGIVLMGWVPWSVFSGRMKVTLDRKHKSFYELTKWHLCCLLRNSALPHQAAGKPKALYCSTSKGQNDSSIPAFQISLVFSFQMCCFPSNHSGHSGPRVSKPQAGTPRFTLPEGECELDAKAPSGTCWTVQGAMAQPVPVSCSWFFPGSWCQCKVCILI